MRKSGKMAYMCLVLCLCAGMLAGCGDKASGRESSSVSDETLAGTTADETRGDGKDRVGAGEEERPSQAEKDGESPAPETLIGTVKSIGDNSVVVSRAFEDTEAEEVLIAPAEGGTDEELVAVYFSENVKFEVRTVKNGGVNEEDVASRDGSFSDLREKMSVDLYGVYEGENFRADSVIMYIFE